MLSQNHKNWNIVENKSPNPGFCKDYMVKQRLGEEKSRSLATSHNRIHLPCSNRCFFLASPGACRSTDTPALVVAGICNSVLCQEELRLIHDCALIFCDFPWRLCLCWHFSYMIPTDSSNACCIEWQIWVGWQRPLRPSSPAVNSAVLSDECCVWHGSFNEHKRRNTYT